MQWVLTVACSITASLSVVAGGPNTDGLSFSLLKDIRSELGFIPYTPKERVLVAKNALNLFSVSRLGLDAESSLMTRLLVRVHQLLIFYQNRFTLIVKRNWITMEGNSRILTLYQERLLSSIRPAT